MIKIIDGLRLTGSGANVDIPPQTVNMTAVNSGSVDMANFAELIVVATQGAVTGAGVGAVQIQESNEAAANFTNVTNALLQFNNTSNMQRVWSIEWRKPTRKRYARLQANTATNAALITASTLRCRPTRANLTMDGTGTNQTDS